ncbi:MAG: hypothetical protein NZZ41_03415, partial [Candidatus Dojkabacteria bacterium]|nr:hypothetical protein [Candidatus Dojkabacteria bacterium]
NNGTIVIKNESVLFKILNTESRFSYVMDRTLNGSKITTYEIQFNNTTINDIQKYDILREIGIRLKERIRLSNISVGIETKKLVDQQKYVIEFSFPQSEKFTEYIQTLLKNGHIDFYAIKIASFTSTEIENNNQNSKPESVDGKSQPKIDFKPLNISRADIRSSIRNDYSTEKLNDKIKIGTYWIFEFSEAAKNEFKQYINQGYSIFMDIEGYQFRIIPFISNLEGDTLTIPTADNTIRAILVNNNIENDREKQIILNILKSFVYTPLPTNDISFKLVDEKLEAGILSAEFVLEFILCMLIVISIFFQRLYKLVGYTKTLNSFLILAFNILLTVSIVKVFRLPISTYTLLSLTIFIFVYLLYIYRLNSLSTIQNENTIEKKLKLKMNTFWIVTFVFSALLINQNFSYYSNDILIILFIGSIIVFLTNATILKKFIK